MFNNVAQNYGRDPLGRMSRRHVYSPGAGNISVEHYSYNAMSRLSSTYREEDGLSDSFGYDASGQLTSMNSQRSNRWVGYSWDNAGNRTQVNDNGWVYGYGVNSLNQYAWTGDGGGVGNGSEHEIGSYQGVSYGYYADRRLASVSGPGGTYNLAYDGLGRTVQRNLNGVTTYYIYDGEKPIYEYKADGSTAGWNVYGKGIDEPLLRADYVAAPGGQGYFFQQDHEGSVTHLTGWGGEVIESYRYDAFGAPTTTHSGGNFNNRFKFTGREYVPQFGFYEYRNRAYHPGLGRFMSEDPIGFQMAGAKPSAEAAALFPRGHAPTAYPASEFNLFRYCHNDPVNRSDPSGLISGITVELQKLRTVTGSNIPQWVTVLKGVADGALKAAFTNLVKAAIGVPGKKGDHVDRTQSLYTDGSFSDAAKAFHGTHRGTAGPFVRDNHFTEVVPNEKPVAFMLHFHNNIGNVSTAEPSGLDAGAVKSFQAPMLFSSESLYGQNQGVLLRPNGNHEPSQIPVFLNW